MAIKDSEVSAVSVGALLAQNLRIPESVGTTRQPCNWWTT